MTAKTISYIYQMLKANYESKYNKYLKSLDVNITKDKKDKITEELDNAAQAFDEFDNYWNCGGKDGKR